MKILLILPVLFLGGCCCCNIDWLIPDDLADQAAEAVIREGVRVGTGVDVDMEEGRVTIETPEGRLVAGEGVAAVDPRMPVAAHPKCAIGGGLSVETKGDKAVSMAQTDCDVPLADLVDHYEKQLKNLSSDVKRVSMNQGQDGSMTILKIEDGGARFKELSVMMGEDESGKTSAAVIVTLP
ncbi:MAG: hypothetical protein AB8H79_08375 [Myxococcota bacterium]